MIPVPSLMKNGLRGTDDRILMGALGLGVGGELLAKEPLKRSPRSPRVGLFLEEVLLWNVPLLPDLWLALMMIISRMMERGGVVVLLGSADVGIDPLVGCQGASWISPKALTPGRDLDVGTGLVRRTQRNIAVFREPEARPSGIQHCASLGFVVQHLRNAPGTLLVRGP